MKYLWMGILALTFLDNASARADELAHVNQVVSLYQSQSLSLYHSKISTQVITGTFFDSAAESSFLGPNDSPMITFVRSTLHSYHKDEIALITCHELGHFFGSKKFGTYPAPKNGTIAYEGEADYFAGKCFVKYLTQIKKTSASLTRDQIQTFVVAFMSKLYGEKIDLTQVKAMPKGKIDEEYPEVNCRALTMIQGAFKMKRPNCWYNP